jgi:hypothetical protein
METQTGFFKIIGVLGLIPLVLVTAGAGLEGLRVVFFPFWAWDYLFSN